MKKILILGSNPKGTTPLRLDEEMREIDAGLQRAKHRDLFIVYQKWAVRARDIQRAMLDINPQIVHFSGHGTGDEGLVFEDETGQAKLVDGLALAGLFELFAKQVECVVLNGCYSQVQAEALAQHVNYVIGMKKAIGDRAAIEFSVAFYDALGAGKLIEFAYKLGCNAIRMAGITEYLTPVLLKRVDDKSTSDKFMSACGIDYRRLQILLESGDWKEANQETTRLLLRASGREKLGPLDSPGTIGTIGDRDIEKLPCQDLRTIDDLWSKYSNGRFGFTAQTKIIQETSKYNDRWREFCLSVGWTSERLIYTLHSPIGHLPTAPLHFTYGEGTDYNNNIERAYFWNVATIIGRFTECIAAIET